MYSKLRVSLIATNQYNALWAMNERAQERCRIVTYTCYVG